MRLSVETFTVSQNVNSKHHNFISYHAQRKVDLTLTNLRIIYKVKNLRQPSCRPCYVITVICTGPKWEFAQRNHEQNMWDDS